MARFSLNIKTCCLYVTWEIEDQIMAKIFCIPKNMHSHTPMLNRESQSFQLRFRDVQCDLISCFSRYQHEDGKHGKRLLLRPVAPNLLGTIATRFWKNFETTDEHDGKGRDDFVDKPVK